jgi:hypothetical protein
MSRWFRFYTGVVSDPKAQMLPPDLFKHWVNVLCVAAQHDGELPALGVTAFMLGRMADAKAAEILGRLHSAGLLDKTSKSFKPHNWDSRQYKHDGNDPTNADRQKRHRDKTRHKNNGDSNGSNGQNNGGEGVTAKRPEYTEGTNDRIGSAGASNFTEGSKSLADAFLKALGFLTPLSVPLEFAGVDWRAVSWESAGWTPDLIGAEARRIGPDKPLTYYEKVFATAFAKRQAPLPVVEVREAEKLKVTHGKPKSAIIQAADDLCRTIAGFDGPARGTDELRGAAGETPPRLLSHG